MNPWKAARRERIRAEVNRRALDAAVAETQRIRAEQQATARLLAAAEEAIRDLQDRRRLADPTEMRRLRTANALLRDALTAMQERLDDAQRAQLWCDEHHGPVARARALQERDGAA